MGLLYFLESIRNPALDAAMLLITALGEETAFLAAAMIVFWCVDKRKGYYVLVVGFFGTLVNQTLKLTFRVPRPWVLDPAFTIVEQARDAAAGFSFPSGHSTSSVGTFGAIGYTSQNRTVKWLCYSICGLVPLSRMYLGVHTPADVLVGGGLAMVFVGLLAPMARGSEGISLQTIFVVILGFSLGLLAYTKHFPFVIAESQLHNLQSGLKNAYTILGAITGLMIVHPLEKKYINYETKAIWWAQILKVILGFVLVLAVKEGLRVPLDSLFDGHLIARSVRYCLIVITAGLIWPMTFRWFSKIGEKR